MRQILDESARQLGLSGVEQPREDAEILIANVLEVGVSELGSCDDLDIGDAEEQRVRDHIARRGNREPVGYIVGRTPFRGLEIEVDSRVHIPRDDYSGLLVDVALELPISARVHDVGTGSGAAALAIKHERPDLLVSATDISSAAIAVAQSNAARLGLGVSFEAQENLPDGEFDLVVANLPYSAQSELAGDLPPESAHFQPHVALIAGVDALDAIRAFLDVAPCGQRVALEHAPRQAATVRALLDHSDTRRDPAGDERVTVGVVR